MNQKRLDVKSWCNKPFPYNTSAISRVLISVLFGLFVVVFLFSFQPFGIRKIVEDKFIYILYFGVITTTVMLFNYFVLPYFFKKFFNADNWTVIKNITLVLWNIVVISIANWTYDTFIFYKIADQYNLFQFLTFTLGVGIFPVILLVLITERQFNKKNIQFADKLSSEIQSKVEEPHNNTRIKIHSENAREFIELYVDDLLYINSEGNYVTICYFNNNVVENKLLRAPLKNVEKQFDSFDTILRCHRSYIINTQNISKVSGNARSCFIHFKKLDFQVPVSRNFSKKMLGSSKTK